MKKPKSPLKGPFKPLRMDQQEIFDQINAHLQVATAPSTTVKRRRQYHQTVGKKKIEEEKAQANARSSSDEGD